MTGRLVGIDVGTQSAKVVVHDTDGRVVRTGSHPLRAPLTPAPGVVEHPDDDLWDALAVACRAALDGLDGPLLGVGVCGVRFCRAMLRDDGTLAGPVLSWMDSRVSRPYQTVDDEVRWVTSASGYLTHRLTGRPRDSAAAYRGQWPVDTATWDWLADDAELAAFGIPRDRLFELVRPGDVLGEVTASAARHTGLPAGLPVVATGNDKAVEALGCGLVAPGEVLVSLGTYVAGMTVSEPGRHAVGGGTSSRYSWPNFASVPGSYLHESTGIRRGMWTVSWLGDLLGGELVARAEQAKTTVERLLEEGASAVPAGADGLMTVPDWLAPHDAPFRRGAFVGFDGRQGPFHLHRSVLEGLAMTLHGHVAAMCAELDLSPARVVLSGGGSRSDLVMRIFAGVFGLPAVRTRGASAAALGAAICTAVGLGVHRSFAEAVGAMVATELVIEPDPEDHRTYTALGAAYHELPARLEPVLRQTHRI